MDSKESGGEDRLNMDDYKSMDMWDQAAKQIKQNVSRMEKLEVQQFNEAQDWFAKQDKISLFSLGQGSRKDWMAGQSTSLMLGDKDGPSQYERILAILDSREEVWLNTLGIKDELIKKPFGSITMLMHHVLKLKIEISMVEAHRYAALLELIESKLAIGTGDPFQLLHPLVLAVKRALDSVLFLQVTECEIVKLSELKESIFIKFELFDVASMKRSCWSCREEWAVGSLVELIRAKECIGFASVEELTFRPDKQVIF